LGTFRLADYEAVIREIREPHADGKAAVCGLGSNPRIKVLQTSLDALWLVGAARKWLQIKDGTRHAYKTKQATASTDSPQQSPQSIEVNWLRRIGLLRLSQVVAKCVFRGQINIAECRQ
jgi:hypothetical protein